MVPSVLLHSKLTPIVVLSLLVTVGVEPDGTDFGLHVDPGTGLDLKPLGFAPDLTILTCPLTTMACEANAYMCLLGAHQKTAQSTLHLNAPTGCQLLQQITMHLIHLC